MRAWHILLPRHIQQSRKPNPPALAEHLQALRHQGAIEPRERHDITHGRECDDIQQRKQIRLFAAREPSSAAQHTKARRCCQKRDRSGADVFQARWAIQPIGIDHGQHRRQRAFGLVMIQHHHISAAFRGGQSGPRGNAAIHANNQRSAAITKCGNRRRIRPIAFLDAIRHVRCDLAAKITQKPRHQRAGAGAIHIIITEYRDMLTAAHRNRDTIRRRFHIRQARRVRH